MCKHDSYSHLESKKIIHGNQVVEQFPACTIIVTSNAIDGLKHNKHVPNAMKK